MWAEISSDRTTPLKWMTQEGDQFFKRIDGHICTAGGKSRRPFSKTVKPDRFHTDLMGSPNITDGMISNKKNVLRLYMQAEGCGKKDRGIWFLCAKEV